MTHPQPFPIGEFRSRLAALRAVMAERQVDFLIVDQFEHVKYFGGHWPTAAMYQALLIPLDSEPVAVIRALDAAVFSEMSWLTDYVAIGDSDNPLKVVADTILARGHGASAVGLERDSHFLTVNRALELQTLLPGAKMVDFSGIMWEMRQVKSPLELACLEVAAEICDRAAAEGLSAALAGVNEREVLAAITVEALRSGADNAGLGVVVSGPRSAALHGELGHRTLAKGDILHIEMVPQFRGYGSRIMRPKSIGEPTDEQIQTAETMIRIQEEQFHAMKPGAEAKEVDRILREGILAAGLRDSYTNVTGYTLGLLSVPRGTDFTRAFLADSEWQLQQNQVFHMYTWAGGMAFSETVVVKSEGGKRLTKMDRRLFY
ncbi:MULTISPECIES: Xaa-Pro peptidase family protein [unclassified Mesorhizobium]|uniref:M24 family metallopeptidase n=1 Tax=unclassified Mesorhizobium TaxID=325217 RepID=UPI0018DDF6EB|nr:Xaa-Pro peptidase family protein [Mesorhizobium sp. LSJC268A00]